MKDARRCVLKIPWSKRPTIGLKSKGGSQDSQDSGPSTSLLSSSSVAAASSLHVLAHDRAVHHRLVRVGGLAVCRGQYLLDLARGNVPDPVERHVRRQHFGVHSSDHVLQDGVIHDHGAGEPVAAVVGVNGPVLTVDGLVLEELEVRVSSELVVAEEGGHVGARDGLVDQHINGGQGGGEL